MRSIFGAEAQIGSNRGSNVLLKHERLQDLRLIEPEEVGIGDDLQLGREIRIDSQIEKLQARIDEVRLALEFAGPQVGHQAEPVDQIHAKQLDLLAIPVAELAAGEVWIVEDRIEPGGLMITEIYV